MVICYNLLYIGDELGNNPAAVKVKIWNAVLVVTILVIAVLVMKLRNASKIEYF